MDVDAVTLSKLTPVEQAKYIKEGQYFRYRKTGHNMWNCCTSPTSQGLPSPSHPQQIRTTHTQPEPSRNPFTPTPHSALDEYVNSLKTLGKRESNILEVLTTCYEEPAEEIAEISTPGADPIIAYNVDGTKNQKETIRWKARTILTLKDHSNPIELMIL